MQQDPLTKLKNNIMQSIQQGKIDIKESDAKL